MYTLIKKYLLGIYFKYTKCIKCIVHKYIRYTKKYKSFEQLKNWHALWHVGTPSSKIGTPLVLWYVGASIGTLTRWHKKNEKLARFWHVGTWEREHVDHAGTCDTHSTRFNKLGWEVLHQH